MTGAAMSLDEAFLRAVIEAPDEDAHRLVYADWLEDHGQPERAEFIRVQCRLAALPARDPDRPRLEAREKELLERHGQAWTATLPAGVEKWTFRRGFVEEVRVGPTTDLPALFRAAPVRSLHVAPFEPILWYDIDEGWRGTEEQLSAQRAAWDLHNRQVQEMLRTPELARLTSLDLNQIGISPEGYQALAALPASARLAALALSGCPIDPARIEMLLSAPGLSRLTELRLGAAGLRYERLETFLALPGVSRLRLLDLSANMINPENAETLASCPHLAGLTALILQANWIRNAGAAILARSPNLSGLRHLDLASNAIGNAGALALAESPTLNNLEILDLTWKGYPGFLEGPIPNRIDHEAREALTARFGERVLLEPSPQT
jgi:uncharacterized protein (TIGR02996 family)